MEQKQELTQPEQPKRTVRKFDSDDIMRLRSHHVIIDAKNGVTHTGTLMKTFICCGFKQLPQFSDVISDKTGVTDEVFSRRWNEEFRRIPVDDIDVLFKEVEVVNRFKVSPEELQKK